MYKIILIFSLSSILIACDSKKLEQVKEQATNQIQEDDSSVKAQSKTPVQQISKKVSDQPLAIFAYQQTPDQKLSKYCIWTDDANAEGKTYWSIIPSSDLNGKSIFSKDDLNIVQVEIGKSIQNCSDDDRTGNLKYAYAINHEKDWVNSATLKIDRLKVNSDHTYTFDLNKNNVPEQIFVCYNMESMEVFFKEPTSSREFEHTHIQLSYDIDGEIDEDISCGKKFFGKIGIVAKEDAQTGDLIFSSQ